MKKTNSHFILFRTVATIAVLVSSNFISDAIAATATKKPPVPNAKCQELETAIVDSLKQMAALKADSMSDTSAIRETMRASQTSNQQSQIQNNMMLMQARKCPPYAGTLSPAKYLEKAMQCR